MRRGLELGIVALVAGLVGFLVGTVQAPPSGQAHSRTASGDPSQLGTPLQPSQTRPPGAGSRPPGSGPGVAPSGTATGSPTSPHVVQALGLQGSTGGADGAQGAQGTRVGTDGATHGGADPSASSTSGQPAEGGSGAPPRGQPTGQASTGSQTTLSVLARDSRDGQVIEHLWLHARNPGGSRTIEIRGPAEVPLPPGRFVLAVNVPGYTPCELEAELVAGPNRLEVQLTPTPTGVVEGIVHLTAPAGPFLVHLDGIPREFSDPDGLFRIEGVRIGRKLIGFARDDYNLFEQQVQIEVREGEVTHVEVSLAHPGRIVGRVLDHAGQALTGVTITAANSLSGSDTTGRYELVALQPGEHVVRVTSGRYDPFEVLVAVREGQDTTQDLQAPPAAGALLAGRGPGLSSGQAVVLFRPGEARPTRIVLAGAGGTFAFPDLAPGEYRIECGGRAHPLHLGTVDVGDLVLE
jgi:Carboxypeptidase regulatory-like domain